MAVYCLMANFIGKIVSIPFYFQTPNLVPQVLNQFIIYVQKEKKRW